MALKTAPSRLYVKGNAPEIKEFPLIKQVADREKSQFEGYSAGIGNRDDGDDIIMPGAFSKTIKERVPARRVKYIDQHNYSTTKNLWGFVSDAAEVPVDPRDDSMSVARTEGATHLLWSRFQVSSAKDPQEALLKIEEGSLDGLSIGFRIVKASYTLDDDSEEGAEDPFWEWLMGRASRNLEEVIWWETSSVIWGMNTAALVIDNTVKHLLAFAEEVETRGLKVNEEDVRKTLEALGRLVKHPPEGQALRTHMQALKEMEKRVDQALLRIEQMPDDELDTQKKLVQVYDDFRTRVKDATHESFVAYVGESLTIVPSTQDQAEDLKSQIQTLQKQLADIEGDSGDAAAPAGGEESGSTEEAATTDSDPGTEDAGATQDVSEPEQDVLEEESTAREEEEGSRATQDQDEEAGGEPDEAASSQETEDTDFAQLALANLKLLELELT